MEILAPAKLNLFLHITGRRPDGYHQLQTVFQFIDFCDRLSIECRDDGKIISYFQIPGLDMGQDLVSQAAHRLQQASQCSLGADLYLEKHIPTGAGLGGGSSDAAATLMALNRIWQLNWSQDQLMELGLGLGADVPIFIYGQAAWAEGVGEQLQALKLAEPWYVLICPECPVSTKEIFTHPDLTRDADPITIRDFLDGIGENHCQTIVETLYAPVAQALAALGQFGEARMSGTGSSVFLACEDENHAQRVMASLTKEFNVRIVKGLNQSPALKG